MRKSSSWQINDVFLGIVGCLRAHCATHQARIFRKILLIFLPNFSEKLQNFGKIYPTVCWKVILGG